MIKFSKKIILVILLSIISIFIFGEKNESKATYDPNTDPTVTIQCDDINFYKSLLKLNCYMVSDDSTMTIKMYQPHVEMRKQIDISGCKVKSIKGIEKFINLEALNAYNNEITDISPLSNLTNLADLWIYNNNISDITALSNLAKLKSVSLNRNQIVDISSLKNLKNLRFLGLYENKIKDISVLSNLTKLESVGLDYNEITDISVLFDLEPETKLTIYLAGNNINENDLIKLMKDKSSKITIDDIQILADGVNTGVEVDQTDKIYTGKPITTFVRVFTYNTVYYSKDGDIEGYGDGEDLVEGKDYTVSYSNNVNVGTATITIKGKGEYVGTITKTFKILKTKSIKNTTVTGIKNKTYTGKVLKQSVVVKDGNTTLKSGTDYTVSYKNNKKVGTATVVITGKGNYTGTVTKTFKINPKGTSLKKLTKGKKQFKATWKVQKTQTTGYQIQYSTNKKFKSGNKTVKVKKNKTTSSTVKKLKAKKKYYVRIRTYKTVNGKTYYSGWSKVKNVTTKK